MEARQAKPSPVRQALCQLEYTANRRALRVFGAMHALFPPWRGRATGREVRNFLLKRVEKLEKGEGEGRKAHGTIAECIAQAASLHRHPIPACICHQKAAWRFREAQAHARAGEQEMLAGRRLEEVGTKDYSAIALERYRQALKDFSAAGSREGEQRASEAISALLAKTSGGPGTSPNCWPQVIIDNNSPAIVARNLGKK